MKSLAKPDRQVGDPQTPNYNENMSTKHWNEKIQAWKTALNSWSKKSEEDKKSLLSHPALNDFDHTASFEKEVSVDFATLTLTNGKKAFVNVNRVWIHRQQMFGGWRCLKLPSFKEVRINARKISPAIHGVEYQVTFCHSGVNTRDWKAKRFTYNEQMQNWIDKVVSLDSLNAELNAFAMVYKG